MKILTHEIIFNQLEAVQEFPVSFDDAWQWLEYSRKDNAKRNFEKAGFIPGVDFSSFLKTEEREIGATQVEIIEMTVDCFKQWCMLSRTDKGREVRLWYLKVEKEWRQAQEKKTPQTYLEALKALVAVEEEKELLRLQNQELQEETERLSEAVDELFNYSSIIRIAKFNQCSETRFNWRTLKAASAKMGQEVKKVPCPRFQVKNLYSHDVWRYCYPEYQLPETTTLVIRPH